MANQSFIKVSHISRFIRAGQKGGDEPQAMTDAEKLAVIQASQKLREAHACQVKRYNKHLLANQVMLKTAITTTLAIGLLFATPATLLIGGTVALTLGSGIYAMMPMPQAEVDIERAFASAIEADDTAGKVDAWLSRSEEDKLTAEQSKMYRTMYSLSVGLVVGFTVFTFLGSGASLPITVYSAMFALSLFYFAQSEQPVYHQDEMMKVAEVELPTSGC